MGLLEVKIKAGAATDGAAVGAVAAATVVWLVSAALPGVGGEELLSELKNDGRSGIANDGGLTPGNTGVVAIPLPYAVPRFGSIGRDMPKVALYGVCGIGLIADE